MSPVSPRDLVIVFCLQLCQDQAAITVNLSHEWSTSHLRLYSLRVLQPCLGYKAGHLRPGSSQISSGKSTPFQLRSSGQILFLSGQLGNYKSDKQVNSQQTLCPFSCIPVLATPRGKGPQFITTSVLASWSFLPREQFLSSRAHVPCKQQGSFVAQSIGINKGGPMRMPCISCGGGVTPFLHSLVRYGDTVTADHIGEL